MFFYSCLVLRIIQYCFLFLKIRDLCLKYLIYPNCKFLYNIKNETKKEKLKEFIFFFKFKFNNINQQI